MEKVFTNEELTHTIVFSWDESKLITETKFPVCLDFKCYEITGQKEEGIPLYGTHYEDTYDPQNSFCEGHIKWDGCMEIHDLNIHYCGWSRKLEYLMRDIYLWASCIMDEYNLLEYGNLNDLYTHYKLK